MVSIAVARYRRRVSGLGEILAAPVTYDPTKLTWTAAVLAWVLAVPLYFVTKFVGAIPHEGGHALVAKLLFQKVKSIKFETNGNAVTDPGKTPWLFDILITTAGYLGPSMFGLLAVFLLLHGVGTQALLWISLVFLALMLIAVRGWFGLFLVPALIAAIFAVATQMKPPLQTLFTYVWVWFLLIVPVEVTLRHIWRGIYRDGGSDTGVMQRLTRLPSELWALAFLVGNIAALVYGGSLLLHHPA
jgi:hypothetical protein